jgi:hypothetical protein
MIEEDSFVDMNLVFIASILSLVSSDLEAVEFLCLVLCAGSPDLQSRHIAFVGPSELKKSWRKSTHLIVENEDESVDIYQLKTESSLKGKRTRVIDALFDILGKLGGDNIAKQNNDAKVNIVSRGKTELKKNKNADATNELKNLLHGAAILRKVSV